LRGLERAEPALQLERPGERFLNGHLLVEDEADQKREGLVGDEGVRLVVAREVQAVGMRRRHDVDSSPRVFSTEARATRALDLPTHEAGWDGPHL
jgi:hypothetical protein